MSHQELGERGNLALARRLLQRAVQNRITRLARDGVEVKSFFRGRFDG